MGKTGGVNPTRGGMRRCLSGGHRPLAPAQLCQEPRGSAVAKDSEGQIGFESSRTKGTSKLVWPLILFIHGSRLNRDVPRRTWAFSQAITLKPAAAYMSSSVRQKHLLPSAWLTAKQTSATGNVSNPRKRLGPIPCTVGGQEED